MIKETINPKTLNPIDSFLKEPQVSQVRWMHSEQASTRFCLPRARRGGQVGGLECTGKVGNVGALIIRIGFGGRLCYHFNKEPPEPFSSY